jgi:1,4-alpha-glucan branching enzyme
LVGGPAGHPFQPLLDERIAVHALRTGLDDMQLRLGRRPEGIWAPECGYRAGLERLYAAAGVRRILVDGPALHGDTARAHPVGDTDVLCFGRDLDVTYRVWSPRSGYPGGADYRDFHTFDHASGFRPARVTSPRTPPEQKKPWDPERARAAAARDAEDFVGVVRRRLLTLAERDGRPGMCVAAFDTELFGHWWYEGPSWLAAILRALPEAGVQVTTLQGAAEAGHVGDPVELPSSSWGSGKDWRVWDGEQVADITRSNADVQVTLLSTVDEHGCRQRRPELEQLVREAYLALASDWAFMVTKDSAAAYARSRITTHVERFDRLRASLDTGGLQPAELTELRRLDGPFPALDARLL